MKKWILPLLALLFNLHGAAQPSLIPEANWKLAEDYLKSQKDFSGIFVLGANGEIKINHGAGYADRENKIPYTDQTLYTVGSITKPITATAILLLSSKGKISFTDPMDRYFENVPDDKKKITIHQLLTHSSGLPGAIGDDYESISASEFQQRTWSQPLLFTPGTGYEYSNVGYSLLGMIVEKVSGQNYSDFLRDHVFNPAGMRTAGYQNPNANYQLLAHGYLADGTDTGTSRDKNWNGAEPFWHLKANGGILMSAQDMYQWYLALRGNKVLSPDLLKLQTTPYVDEGGGSFYGYGYAVDQNGDCIQHNGSNRIYKADFRWFPKKDVFSFSASNDANVRLFKLHDEIIRILMTGELPEVEDWKEIPPASFPANKNQETAEAFIDLIATFSNEKADVFIPNYCSADIVKRNGEMRLKEIFGMLHADGDHTSNRIISESGDKIQINMQAKGENARLKITLSMVDHKIDRLGAEIQGI